MANEEILESLQKQIAEIEGKRPLSNTTDVAFHASKNNKKREVDLSDADDAFSKIVALVNASDKSEKAIRDRLVRSGFSEAAIEESVERAKSYGFIDDLRYAEVLIRSRLNQGKGMRGIERELSLQLIDIEQVPGWPHEFANDEETELKRALAFLDKKPPRSKNLREGAYRKLVAKGFSSAVASRAARQWSEESAT